MNPITGIDISSNSESVAKITRLSILSAFSRITMAFNQIVLPLFVLFLLLDDSFYGVLVAAAGYVQGVVVFPAGLISDRKGRGPSILFGGLFAGMCLFLFPMVSSDVTMLIIVYALSGLGTGFTRTSIDSLIADYTEKGEERTRSFGYTTAAATITAVFGSFFAGLLLDPVAFPYIPEEMVRYVILFWIMGTFRIATGIFGLYTERWLRVNDPNGYKTAKSKQIEEPLEIPEEATAPRQDTETALFFGFSQLLVGVSSGMVIPYLIPWIYAAFNPDPVVLGSIPAIANLTLATGTLA
ncbi:MAG: MFS transporter, partial [Candidatus Thorarchaeota archaeon]